MNLSQQNSSASNLDAVAAWEKCLGIIKDNVNWRAFQTWFEPIKAAALINNVLTIQVPSQFFYEWLEEHYVELLGKTIKRILGREGRLEYRIQMEATAQQRQQQPATIQLPGSAHPKASKENNYVNLDYVMEDPLKIKNPFVIPGMKRVQIDPQLNPNLSFENYIEGECNRLARTAGVHIAQKPGATAFNPLMIFGGTGCGKTHLLQAIGNEVRRLHPNKSVLYVSTEKFINQFIDHSKNQEVNDFIHFYQLIDVLLLDDIHLFVSATKTQDVFFAIFNHLHQNGKQIVLSSDTPPKDLDGMQERLLSRFRWGLHAEIQSPDYDTRKAILEMKMRNEGLEIPDEVVQYVAYNVQNNVRDLEGTVISLFAQATLNKKEIDLELAKRVLKNFVKASFKELSIDDIQKMVCNFYNVQYNDLLSKTRKREIVQARQITMYFAKKFTRSSLKTIGEHFTGKDHTTVIHSCQTVENLMETDASYREKLLEIQQKVQLAAM
jgi:chromosomal replication initiator protein